jgi:hypothetical protein
MKTFTDTAGRVWTVQIDVTAIKRLRDLLGLDLGGSSEKSPADFAERLLRDPIFLADALYVVCKPEADSRSLSDEDFGRALRGDVIEAAQAALLQEYVDFFPSLQRTALEKLVAQARRLQEATVKLALDRLDRPETEQAVLALIERELDQRLAGLRGASSLPPSPAASPTEGP